MITNDYSELQPNIILGTSSTWLSGQNEKFSMCVEWGGMENTLHVCMNGPWSDIKHCQLEKAVAKYFNLAGYFLDALTILVIKKIHRSRKLSQVEGESLDPVVLVVAPPHCLKVNP